MMDCVELICTSAAASWASLQYHVGSFAYCKWPEFEYETAALINTFEIAHLINPIQSNQKQNPINFVNCELN